MSRAIALMRLEDPRNGNVAEDLGQDPEGTARGAALVVADMAAIRDNGAEVVETTGRKDTEAGEAPPT